MQKLLTYVLDFLFPPEPEVKRLQQTSPAEFELYYQPKAIGDTVVLSSYTNPMIRAAITENKFRHHQAAAKLLAALVSYWITEHPGSYIFIPVPLGDKRLRERGHNQAATVLGHIGEQAVIETSWLRRIRETRPQTQLPKEMRQQNVAGVFQCPLDKIEVAKETTVVLFDDVITTGATMAAARAELSAHLPPETKLICLALAH